MGKSMYWDESLSVGCDLIDGQHKELINLVTELEESARSGLTNEQLARALKFIVNYTRHHFLAEEELMKSIGFNELPHHRELHNELVHKVTEILLQMKEGKDPEAPNLIQFFIEWVKKHVNEEDRKIGTYWRKWSNGAKVMDCRIKSVSERRAAIIPRLDKLKELFRIKLIEIDDFKAKKQSLFEGLFVELGPNKIAEGLSDLDHFLKVDIIGSKERDLIIEGYLRKLNPEADLEVISEVEDKLIFVRLLRERELITEEKFNQLKTRILEAI